MLICAFVFAYSKCSFSHEAADLFFIFEKIISFFCSSEKNDLSYIETSALDATNVDKAFETILTGRHIVFVLSCFVRLKEPVNNYCPAIQGRSHRFLFISNEREF